MGIKICNAVTFSLIAGVVLSLSFVCGCSDTPENQASKKARAATESALTKALEEKDFQAAGQQLSGVGRKAGKNVSDNVALTAGSLALSHSRQLSWDLGLKEAKINATVRKIIDRTRRWSKLTLENERLGALVALSDKELLELRQVIDGSSRFEGLTIQLAKTKAGLVQLEDQKQQLAAEQSDVEAMLQQMQTQADAMLKDAEILSGDARLVKEKQAYNMLLAKKPHYVNSQGLLDRIANIDSQIAIVGPQVAKLEKDLADTQQAIVGIENSAELRDLRGQVDEISGLIAKNKSECGTFAEQFNSQMEDYAAAVQAVVEAGQNAVGQLKRVSSNSPVAAAAKQKLADSLAIGADVNANKIIFEKDLSFAMNDLFQNEDGVIGDFLKASIKVPSGSYGQEQLDALFAVFDNADAEYEAAMSVAKRLGGEAGKVAACSVLKTRLLLLSQKIKLADRLDLFELADAGDKKLAELQAEGKEFGVIYVKSEVAKIVESGLDYTPELLVDMEIYFEGLKSRFVSWRGLAGVEKEAKVNELLQLIEEKEQEFGELPASIQTEKKALLDAIERGFDEEATGSNEPNSI